MKSGRIKRQRRQRVFGVAFEAAPRERKHVSNGRRQGPGGKPTIDWSKAEGLWNRAAMATIAKVCDCSRQAVYYRYLSRQNNPDICEEFARLQARVLMRRVRVSRDQ